MNFICLARNFDVNFICHARNFDMNFMQTFSNFLAGNFVQLSPLLGIWLGFQTLSNLFFQPLVNQQVRCLVFSTLRFDEILASIILQGIKPRGKGGREKGSKSEAQKTQIGSQRGKGSNYDAPETPPVVRSISGKERDRPGITLVARTLPVWYDLM